jgi:hypothetical protein
MRVQVVLIVVAMAVFVGTRLMVMSVTVLLAGQ